MNHNLQMDTFNKVISELSEPEMMLLVELLDGVKGARANNA